MHKQIETSWSREASTKHKFGGVKQVTWKSKLHKKITNLSGKKSQTTMCEILEQVTLKSKLHKQIQQFSGKNRTEMGSSR